jgi:hypothetical protein
MDEWSDGKAPPHPSSSVGLWGTNFQACKIEFPIPVAVRNLDPSFDLDGLIRNAQHHIDDANDFNAHHLRLHHATGLPLNPHS